MVGVHQDVDFGVDPPATADDGGITWDRLLECGTINDAGVFGYMLKPVSRDQLRVGIEVAWKRYLDWFDQHGEISELKERLEHRKIIEQAKWILVKRKGIEEPEAMKLLQKQARNNRKTLIEVATAVVESDSLLGD